MLNLPSRASCYVPLGYDGESFAPSASHSRGPLIQSLDGEPVCSSHSRAPLIQSLDGEFGDFRDQGDDTAEDFDLCPIELTPRGQSQVKFNGVDIVQFSSPLYYADAREGSLMIDVMRLGSMNGEVAAKWSTEDGSAKAGVRYKAASGKVVFEDGVSNVAIEVELLPQKDWYATLEFNLNLSDPDPTCELGIYLKSCRVKLVESSMFPSDKCRRVLKKMDIDTGEPPHSKLVIWEYLKLNLKVPGIARRTLINMLGDQLENLYLLLTLTLNVYLVDVILNMQDPGTEARLILSSREETAMLVGALYFLPLILIHLWHFLRQKCFSVTGKTREFLQTSLFRKYMNYNEESRRKAAAITVALLKDCPRVAELYQNMVGLSQQLCRLILLQCFMVLHHREAWWVLLVMPTVMAAFGVCLLRNLEHYASERERQERRVGSLMAEIQGQYELISSYYLRPQVNQTCEEEVSKITRALTVEGVCILNYLVCPQYIGPLFTGVWIAYCSRAVLKKQTTLGMLLALVSVFGKVASDFGKLYETALEVRRLGLGLHSLTRLLNMDTDCCMMKSVNRKRRELTKYSRQRALKKLSFSVLGRPVTDTMALAMRSVYFQYSKQYNLFPFSINVSAHQSSLVAITGENGHGRQTLLRLLAFKLFPRSGVIFIPTHLRVLHVSQDPIILSCSAWRNLTFACSNAATERVHEILSLLNMDYTRKLVEDELQHLDTDEAPRGGFCHVKPHWIDALSDSERMRLHLARAFIMNPEVMVLQRPLKHFTSAQWRLVMRVMKSHIEGRGIDMPAESRGRRRPRTVFFSAEFHEQAIHADVIWAIEHDGSVNMSLPDASRRTSLYIPV